MPGLVGATFRKSGCLAAFRGSITYQNEEDAQAACRDGSITLKLFNLLVSEIGPSFLERGIWVDGSDLYECLQPHLTDIDTIFVDIKEDNKEIDPQQIADMRWNMPGKHFFLQATCES
jgi:hypothetical protein